MPVPHATTWLRNQRIDWLERYGEAGDFVRDADLLDYDERFEFVPFIMRKGNEFEAAIVQHLSSITSLLTVAGRQGRQSGLSRC